MHRQYLTGAPLNGGSCNDGNPCTIDDTCVNGVCQGTPTSEIPCGTGGCGVCANGFCMTMANKLGTPCDDGFKCTGDDVCLAGGFCLGIIKACPDSDTDRCTIDACDPQTGECVNVGPRDCGPCAQCEAQTGACAPANEGVACDDLDVCTATSTCSDGVCVGAQGTPMDTPTPTATVKHTPKPTKTPVMAKPGHGPLSAEPYAAPIAVCIAKCREVGGSVSDFLRCKAQCGN